MNSVLAPAVDPNPVPALLAAFSALRDLDEGLEARLARQLKWVRAPRGGILFDAGDRCLGFPLLTEGEVQVIRSTPDGHEIELYRIHPGESCIVSTSCLLGAADYPARGQALNDVALAILPQDLFDALLTAHPPFRRHVFGLFAERLTLMMQRVEEVAFRSLTRRLAAVVGAGSDDFLETTHERLAAQIGASREAVSRALKKLEEGGCIRLGRGRIDLLDRTKLMAEG